MLYTDFIFKDFIWKFRRFFRFNKASLQEFTFLKRQTKTNELKVNTQSKKVQFPYYTFEDQFYSRFMLSLMNLLEVRSFNKREIIANEMDESLEVLFVESGIYDVGYEINKKVFYERQYGTSTIIGGFQICYNRRYNFTFRAFTKMSCLAIRKQKFLTLLKKFPYLKY